MIFDPNYLFYWMVKTYHDNKTDGNKVVIMNEGSSRSSKTWDFFHFLYYYLSNHHHQEVVILRRTLKNARERSFADFKECLTAMGVYNNSSVFAENTSPVYTLFGSKVKFLGLDNDSEPRGTDIVFCNEMLEIESERFVKGWKLRCRKLFVGDWNPKYTYHWAFDWEKHPFTYFSKTTYKNNKHLDKSIIADIESTSPWNLEDLHLPESQRRPHHENIRNKTADEWYFKVYGMGERANRDGLVYPNVNWIDKFPKNYDRVGYAMDLGFTNSPTALSKVTTNGRELYAECLIYTPTKEPEYLGKLLKAVGLKNEAIWCDSAHPLFIGTLRELGFNVFAIKKQGIMDTIGLVKRYNLNIVNNPDVRKEQENYTMREVNGISLDEPNKGHDHFFDALRYNVMANFRII